MVSVHFVPSLLGDSDDAVPPSTTVSSVHTKHEVERSCQQISTDVHGVMSVMPFTPFDGAGHCSPTVGAAPVEFLRRRRAACCDNERGALEFVRHDNRLRRASTRRFGGALQQLRWRVLGHREQAYRIVQSVKGLTTQPVRLECPNGQSGSGFGRSVRTVNRAWF